MIAQQVRSGMRKAARSDLRLTSVLWAALGLAVSAWAATVSAAEPPGLAATSSAAARRSALQSIPYDKLDAQGRAKVDAVLGNVTVFRRFPIRVVACDPDLYLFAIRHPDVIVNIWEVMGLAQLQFRQTGPDTYHVAESAGTSTEVEFLYHTHDTHLIYGEWRDTGPLLARTVHGRCLAILKSGYVRETDGRYYVTSRLDGFLSVEPGGAELLDQGLARAGRQERRRQFRADGLLSQQPVAHGRGELPRSGAAGPAAQPRAAGGASAVRAGGHGGGAAGRPASAGPRAKPRRWPAGPTARPSSRRTPHAPREDARRADRAPREAWSRMVPGDEYD